MQDPPPLSSPLEKIIKQNIIQKKNVKKERKLMQFFLLDIILWYDCGKMYFFISRGTNICDYFIIVQII